MFSPIKVETLEIFTYFVFLFAVQCAGSVKKGEEEAEVGH